MKEHWAIFIDNTSKKTDFIRRLLKEPSLLNLDKQKGVLFSKIALERYMDEEDRHGKKIINKNEEQSLKSMSSGEQKKSLLQYILKGNPDFIVLDNPFDNLDISSQENLKTALLERSKKTLLVQIINRKDDLLPFIKNYAKLNNEALAFHEKLASIFKGETPVFNKPIPEAIQPITYANEVLIDIRNNTIIYGTKTVLKNINWTIKKGEFWQLIGKNGSGKTTILSIITGENPKGYGQELYLFGRKKGSGESIWDIKKNIGYFTPSMTDKFGGYHSLENMIISGLNDSIGLYKYPTEIQLGVAKDWLSLINMYHLKDKLFNTLSIGHQRLVMTIRAMVKRPLLLIMDEPTTGLDDASAKLLITLVHKIAKESSTAVVFVSHRNEPGLAPDFIYELQMTDEGSRGYIKSN